MTYRVRPVWRLLADDGAREPVRGLALDEALVRCLRPRTTLRLWRLSRCVVVGRAQVVHAEVDEAACRELRVPVLRRFTGGGAVYQDPGNLDVTLVIRRDDPLLAADPTLTRIPGLDRLVTEPLAAAVRAFGLPARASERGVFVEESKVSGVAAWVGRETVLVHATLLVDADLAVLGRTLAGPGAPGDPRWERTMSRRMPVTSLAQALGGRAPAASLVDAAVVAALVGGRRAIQPDTLEPGELATADRLIAERYERSEWHATGEVAA